MASAARWKGRRTGGIAGLGEGLGGDGGRESENCGGSDLVDEEGEERLLFLGLFFILSLIGRPPMPSLQTPLHLLGIALLPLPHLGFGHF